MTKPGCASGKWTVQQAAELSVAAPTIEAALDARFLSGVKEERVAAAKFYEKQGIKAPSPAEVSSSTSPKALHVIRGGKSKSRRLAGFSLQSLLGNQ